MNRTAHRSIAAWLAVPVLLFLVVDDGWAYCTTSERIQLRNEGVPPYEIERLCGGGSTAPPPPMPPPQMRPATVCVTTVGSCFMMVALPPGSTCACYTQWGAIPGIAQ